MCYCGEFREEHTASGHCPDFPLFTPVGAAPANPVPAEVKTSVLLRKEHLNATLDSLRHKIFDARRTVAEWDSAATEVVVLSKFLDEI